MTVWTDEDGTRRSPRGSVDRNPQSRHPCRPAGTSLPARERGSKRRQGLCLPHGLRSLPARERGSKLVVLGLILAQQKVAPRAGAWIETDNHLHPRRLRQVAPRAGAWIETGFTSLSTASFSRVAPRAGAWIETPPGARARKECQVAPRAGAWIETCQVWHQAAASMVAPRAGAWIETQERLPTQGRHKSLPARERGSKLGDLEADNKSATGRSPRGSVDRNSYRRALCMTPRRSLPARERGSKQRMACAQRTERPSLPARERGSKPGRARDHGRAERVAPRAGAWIETRPIHPRSPPAAVAPRAGAWIETQSWPRSRRRPESLPARERGSKQGSSVLKSQHSGRSPRGSVDRNHAQREPGAGRWRRSPRGSVDRNSRIPARFAACGVAPRAGAWIETGMPKFSCTQSAVAPRAGAWIETAPRGGSTPCWWIVAPRAGAWIETSWPRWCRAAPARRSPRVTVGRNTTLPVDSRVVSNVFTSGTGHANGSATLLTKVCKRNADFACQDIPQDTKCVPTAFRNSP